MTNETRQFIREELQNNLNLCNANISFSESSCVADIQRVYVDDSLDCIDDDGKKSSPRMILAGYVTTRCATGKGISNARLESSFRKYLAELDHKQRLESVLAEI